MNFIYTPNIFFTTSFDVMNKFMGEQETVANFSEARNKFLKEINQKQVYIISPETNKNLIEFDFSLGYGKENMGLNLHLVETGEVFEFFLAGGSDLSTQIYQMMASELSELSTSVLDKTGVSKVLKDISVPNTRTFYFSFGVGPDTKNWSGPFTLTLVGAQTYLTADGVREIKLSFVNDTGMLRSNALNTKLSGNLESAVNKYSQLTLGNSWIRSEVRLIDNTENELNTSSVLFMKDCIEEYIKNVFKSQAIVLLPKLKSKSEVQGIIEFEQNQVDLQGISPIETTSNNITLDSYYNDFGFIVDRVMKKNTDQSSVVVVADQAAETPPEVGTLDLVFANDNLNNNDLYESLPDFYKPLQIFADGVSRSIKSFYESIPPQEHQLELIIENNLSVLKLWKKYGWISDDSKPVMLFAPRKYIDELFYFTINNGNPSDIDKTTGLILIDEEDRKKYFNKNYRKEYYDKFLSRASNSSFNENVFRNDSDLIIDEILKKEKTSDIPIFRYNMNNPNVLGLNIEDNPGYLQLFTLDNSDITKSLFATNTQRIIESILKDKAFDELTKVVANRVLPSFLQTNRIGLDYYETDARSPYPLAMRAEQNYSNRTILPGSIEGMLPGDIGVAEGEELTKLISGELSDEWLVEPRYAKLLEDIQIKTNGKYNNLDISTIRTIIILKVLKEYLSQDVDSKFKITPPSFTSKAISERTNSDKLELINKLSRICINVNIKTLPFFHLAGNNIINLLCLLVGRTNKIISTDPRRFGKMESENYFNGLYRIKGFKHVVTSTDMYSEFNLIKELRASENLNTIKTIDVQGTPSVKTLGEITSVALKTVREVKGR